MEIALDENATMDKTNVDNDALTQSLDTSHSKISASLEQELSKQHLVGESSDRKELHVELIAANL